MNYEKKVISEMTLDELIWEEELLHKDLVLEYDLVAEELTFILDISAVTFIFPVQLLCRYIAARKTRREFSTTISDYFDIFVFLMVAWVWEVIEVYMNTDIKEELFGPVEDS